MKIETLPLAQAQPTTRPRRWKKPAAALLIVLLAGGGWAYMQNQGRRRAGQDSPGRPGQG